VPAGGDLTEPGGQMSVIHDNRNRIATRLNQLRTGRRQVLLVNRERALPTLAFLI
jgi:hypothetical protein